MHNHQAALGPTRHRTLATYDSKNTTGPVALQFVAVKARRLTSIIALPLARFARRVDQRWILAVDDHMASQKEGAALLLHCVRLSQLRHQMVGKKAAELTEERELSPRWLALSLIFHAPPCGRVHRPPHLAGWC